MATTYNYVSAMNQFIPTAEKALQTNYSLNPSKFRLNQYITLAKVQKSAFYAIMHDPDEVSRISYSDGRDFLWADGAEPQVNFAKGSTFTEFNTTRYAETFYIGDIAAENTADLWDLITDSADGATSRLMTWRTQNVVNNLRNASWGANTGNPVGGKWDTATATSRYIQDSINSAVVTIEQATNAVVNKDNLFLVVSPDVAQQMGASTEITDLIKQSPFARDWLEGNALAYGLPPRLYGLGGVIVDNTVYNSAKHGAARSANYVFQNEAYLVNRADMLQGSLNTMGCITLGMFQDLSVLLNHQPDNLRTKGTVYDNYSVIIRPYGGYYFTNPVTSL